MRRATLAAALALAGCMSAAPKPAPTADQRPKPRVDLSYDNLSPFHGDGTRLFFSKTGRALVETLVRDPQGKLALRRQLWDMDAAEAAEHARFIDAFPAGVTLNDRMGIPDEVRVRFSVGAQDLSVWERDIPGQPEPFQRLMVEVSKLLAAAQRVPYSTAPLTGGQVPWPSEFAPR